MSVALLLSASASATSSLAQHDWQDYEKRITASPKVAPLGPNLMGEAVRLSNGALSFSVTDVSIPGNSSLPVAFSRSYSVFNREGYGDLGPLGDWQLDLPRISAINLGNWDNAAGGRCSAYPNPTSSVDPQVNLAKFWAGVSLEIPGSTSSELLRGRSDISKPTLSAADEARLVSTQPVWVTSDQTHVFCLSSLDSKSLGGGEGFLAVTADGTKYWFDWMAQTDEPQMERLVNDDVPGTSMEYQGNYWYWISSDRKKTSLYVTRVEDRFGNAVDYTYVNSWDKPVRLTQISDVNEDRVLEISYRDGLIESVSDRERTWNYRYESAGSGRKTLTSVVLPDLSQWTIDFDQFTNAYIDNDIGSAGEVTRGCFWTDPPRNLNIEPVGTLTHPSGAIGTFTVNLQEHGRHAVPVVCDGIEFDTDGLVDGNTQDDINFTAISAYSFTLKSKQISGAGLGNLLWEYTYPGDRSSEYFPPGGATHKDPRCTISEAVCRPISTDAFSNETFVRGPGGAWVRYMYGATYLYNEGKLLSVEVGDDQNGSLQTTYFTYDLSQDDKAYASGGYPAQFGNSTKLENFGFEDEFLRPNISRRIFRQGANFHRRIDDFDSFARPVSIATWSELAGDGVSSFARTESFTYHDDLSLWAIGQVKSFSIDGTQVSAATYQSGTALRETYSSYGKLVQTLGYHSNDGTLATITDGNNNVTTLSDWYRGVPRRVEYADQKFQTAVVNTRGLITSVTDQNRVISTGYGYDPMGRLTSISPPAGDSVAWSPTTIVFEQSRTAAPAMGIDGGHWKRTETRGNYRKVTYYNGLWQPLLQREYDAANVTGTERFSGWRYDAEGRVVFEAYPVPSVSGVGEFTAGVSTTYDGLGRPTVISQSSELGPLHSYLQYLSNFTTTQTNPRSFATTTSFQVFDDPDSAVPVTITAPESVSTVISRDVFGNPRSITRSGPNAAGFPGNVTATRSYVYDGHKRLCKIIEPEAASTVMDYDAAGNIAWTASGLGLPSTTSCNRESVVATQKVQRGYDGLNRLDTLTFPDGRGNLDYTYTPDGLPSTIVVNNAPGNSVTTGYIYNRLRQVTSETITHSDGPIHSMGYGYEPTGHLSSLTYPSGRIDLAPNALGQPGQVGTYATGVTYYPNGAIDGFTYGNGLIHKLTRNERGLPERSKDSLGTYVVHDDGYDFDENGNPKGISDGLLGQRGNRNMNYDGLDRLTWASSPMFGSANYSYDALDNLKTVSIGDRSHTYNYGTKQQLDSINVTGTTFQVKSFQYDVRGNLSSTSNGQSYTFDFGNRLRSVPGLEDYRYDAHGRRVRAYAPGRGSIYSMYGHDGVLRYQHDERTSVVTEYFYLGGSLIARTAAPTTAAAAQ